MHCIHSNLESFGYISCCMQFTLCRGGVWLETTELCNRRYCDYYARNSVFLLASRRALREMEKREDVVPRCSLA